MAKNRYRSSFEIYQNSDVSSTNLALRILSSSTVFLHWPLSDVGDDSRGEHSGIRLLDGSVDTGDAPARNDYADFLRGRIHLPVRSLALHANMGADLVHHVRLSVDDSDYLPVYSRKLSVALLKT